MNNQKLFLLSFLLFVGVATLFNVIDSFSFNLIITYYMTTYPFYILGGIGTILFSALLFALSTYKLNNMFPRVFNPKIYFTISAIFLALSYYLTFATTSLSIFPYIEMNGFEFTFFSMITLSLIISLSSLLLNDLINFIRNMKETGASVSGMVASLFSLGCPTCGSIIYSLLGITGGLTLLPLKGLEFKFISLGLLFYGVKALNDRSLVNPKKLEVSEPKAASTTQNPSPTSFFSTNTLLLGLILLVLPVLVFAQIQLMDLNNELSPQSSSPTSLSPSVARSPAGEVDVYSLSSTEQTIVAVFPELASASSEEEVMNILYPTGDPTYSAQLGGVTYNDPVTSMEYLARYYFVIKEQVRKENPEVWDRYIKLAAAPRGISCEFCCGVGPQGIDSQGNLRCGCKHNIALQALTLGLMSNTDLSDTEILREVMKWKTLFFPRNMVYLGVQLAGKDPSQVASSKLPGMVGGC